MGHNVVGLMIPEFLPCATMRCLQNRLVIMTYRLTILRGKMEKISTSIGVWNWGTPKSSISMVFSIISHLFWVAPWLWKPPIGSNWCLKLWWIFSPPGLPSIFSWSLETIPARNGSCVSGNGPYTQNCYYICVLIGKIDHKWDDLLAPVCQSSFTHRSFFVKNYLISPESKPHWNQVVSSIKHNSCS